MNVAVKVSARADGERLFCSKPFTWFEVSTHPAEGDTHLCCPGWIEKPIGNVLHSTVEEVWNSAVAADVRRSVLDGSFEYCSRTRCPFLQNESGPVQRVKDVTDPALIQAIDENLTVLPWGPKEVVACFDRSCNLSCPSCRTGLIMAHDSRDRITSIQQRLSSEALKDARLLFITGSGDPFGSPFFRNWLQNLRRADMPRLETIHLHTNALLWTSRMWRTIPEEIRDLVTEADISIDAARPETYALNRRGGDFSRLLENLDFISSELKPMPLKHLSISMVVQKNNFEEMREFVDLGRRFGVDFIYFSQLVNWGTFSEGDFADRAIHFPDHPDHQRLLEVLKDPIFDAPGVSAGNLTSVRMAAVSDAADATRMMAAVA